jgi:hypothetical protein
MRSAERAKCTVCDSALPQGLRDRPATGRVCGGPSTYSDVGLGRAGSRRCSLRRLGFFRRCLHCPVLRAAPAVVALIRFRNVIFRATSWAYKSPPPRYNRPPGRHRKRGVSRLRNGSGGHADRPESRRQPAERPTPIARGDVVCPPSVQNPQHEGDRQDDENPGCVGVGEALVGVHGLRFFPMRGSWEVSHPGSAIQLGSCGSRVRN